MADEQTGIVFDQVSFTYASAQAPAITDVTLTIRPGEVVLVTGPSGSGKTTFCCCINGLVPKHHEGQLEGRVTVDGYDTRRARIGGLASIVGMVFQDPESQLVTASVADEVAFGAENLGVPREEIEERVRQALHLTRLEGYEDREPFNLSGGEQQATVIAGTQAMHPRVYVLDEPLANLDPAGRSRVLSLLIDIVKQRGTTLVLVEHALDEVLPLVDRVIVFDRGRIVRDGPTREVLAEGDTPAFTRPAVVRLGERLGLSPLPLTPEALVHGFERLGPVAAPVTAPPPVLPSVTGEVALRFERVTYAYEGRPAAIADVDLTIHRGELVAMLGRNGSGKSTLARHVIGLLQPQQGRVTVMGRDAATTPTHELARHVGFCFQNPNHQLVAFGVAAEMRFGLRAHDIPVEEYDERVTEALAAVDLLEAQDAEVFDLGKGQKQRLALASVLALRPELLVIDEPTTGQDPQMAIEIFQIIQRLHAEGMTVLMITHRLDHAARYADRAIVMQHGRKAFDGAFVELLQDDELLSANALEPPHTTRVARALSAYGVPPWLVVEEDLSAAVLARVGVPHGD
jgi:energy-coupling factor transport system ATP-binding protein